MNETIVTQLPSNDRIDLKAEEIGAMLLQVTSRDERLPIYTYGRLLLAHVEPTASFTLRFYAALASVAARLPDYQTFTRDYVLYASVISRLQCRIAVYVARAEAVGR